MGWLVAGLLARVQLTATVVMRTPPLLCVAWLVLVPAPTLPLMSPARTVLYCRCRAALQQGPERGSAELHSDRIYS